MNELHDSYSSKKAENTRVKVKPRKKTVGITLHQNLIKRAREHNLNISKVTEQALLGILDYLETQNSERIPDFSSSGSFLKESVVDGDRSMPAFEPSQFHVMHKTCVILRFG